MGLDGTPRTPNLANGFARSPRTPRFTKREKVAITVVVGVVIVSVIIISAIIPGTQTSTIRRTASSEEEMEAILAAEDMDMAGILEIERFSLESVNGFRYSNVADGETIEFYLDLIETMDRPLNQDNAAFEYVARCQHVEQISLLPSKIYPGQTAAYGGVFSMNSSHADAAFEGHFRYLDLDGLLRNEEGYFLEDAYIIRQLLRFDLFLSDEYHLFIEQLVILDGDLNLKVMMSDPDWREVPLCYG
jgi:hypothetical protein